MQTTLSSFFGQTSSKVKTQQYVESTLAAKETEALNTEYVKFNEESCFPT